MNKSIPGRYGFKRKSEQRQAALDLVWRACAPLVLEELLHQAEPPRCDVEWSPGLDPADGQLGCEKAERKRAQVSSLAAHALQMMAPGSHVVEFGAGTGHLGLLLAHLRPDAQVVLVETREGSCLNATERVERLGVPNCRVFHGSVDDYAATEEHFDLAVGLHTCGLLTDAVLACAVRRGAAACVSPCCYGQVVGAEDHDRGEGVAVRAAPLSSKFGTALAPEGEWGNPAFVWCARSADFSAGRGGAFAENSPGFLTALRCMRTIDTDRLWWARERGYSGCLGNLQPLTCSPKCCVIRLVPGAQEQVAVAGTVVQDEDARGHDAPAVTDSGSLVADVARSQDT